MAIDKQILFDTTVALWPDVIPLSGGLEKLNDIYLDNETAYPAEDNWRQVAMWSFHQALWVNAKKAIAAGRETVRPRRVNMKTFDKWMLRNLSGDDCWSKELIEYEFAVKSA